VRRQQSADTRERIITAGSELVHGIPSWDWGGLTFQAVADRAGVGRRTVFRHFPTERHLHDAIMKRLEAEAGLTYDDLALDDVGTVTSRMFASLASFAAASTPSTDSYPLLDAADDRRRQALREAVEAAAPHWTEDQQVGAAAALDVLWSLPSYERLVAQWRLDPRRATSIIEWLIGAVVDAVKRDAPPPQPAAKRRRRR
jgi:AcrR family transcriptional regulator